MAYQSGEFNFGDTYESVTPGPAAVFNNTIFYLCTQQIVDLGEMMFENTVFTFDLTKLIRNGSTPAGEDPISDVGLKDPANWVSSAGPPYPSAAQSALAATADTLYGFFNTVNNGMQTPTPNPITASAYTLPQNNPGQPGSWGAPISLLESDNITVPKPASSASGMGATLVGENIMIVTCSAARSAKSPSGGTFVGIYDTTTIDTDKNTWAAQWHTYLPLQAPLTPDNAYYVWTDWYSSQGTGSDPGFTLAIMVESGKTPSANHIPDYYYWSLPMAVTGTSGKTAVTISVPPVAPASAGFDNIPAAPFIFSSLKRDPAGRLRIWASSPRDTWSASLSAGTIGTTHPVPGGVGITFYNEVLPVTYRDSSMQPPTSLFYTFNDGKSETTVNGNPATQYPVYEFIFYGYELQTCQVVRCGTIQVVPGYSQPTLKHPIKEINIIAGIIDGPVPLPIVNYQGHNMGSDTYDAGSVTYGTTDTNTKERKVSNSWTVGFETTGDTSKGVGPAWDISFKGGMGSVSGDSKETSLSYYLEQGASISFDKDLNAELDPKGALRKVGVQFSITAFSYFDNFGVNVDSTTAADANAPKPASVLTTMVDPGGLDFSCRLFTPGVLETYKPEAINAKMKSFGYTGDNYFGDVICQNAYPFTNADNPFLSFTYSPSSKSGQAFSQFTSSFQENSWTLDTKIYAGVSGGADIFGVEEFEAKFLAGVEYQHESTESENNGTEWGVELGENWILPEGNTPDSVASYDFRVFFLPVPSSPSSLGKTHWTDELLTYMDPNGETTPEMIDPNSGAWRITYAVTKIIYKDEESNPAWSYDGSLDKPSVYRATNKPIVKGLEQIDCPRES